MQCRPDVPFLALTTLSVEERNMYFLAATVTPDCARLSVLLYLPSRLFSSSTDTWPEKNLDKFFILSSVADPDPNPDPHVFGPPGSGSICQRYGSGSCFGSGSFYHQAKTARKTLIHRVLLVTSFRLFIFKMI